jgi:uncharacterized protein (TIGR01568 family)
MCIKNDGDEPRRPTVVGPLGDGLDVKVITSESEIIIDLRKGDTPERKLRRIVTRPVRRQPEPHEPDGSHVDVADVTVREKDRPQRKLNPIVTRPARRQPEPNEPDGIHADVTAKASSASEKSGVSKPRRSSASSSSGRRRLKMRVKSPRLPAISRRRKPPARNWPPVIADSYPVVKMTRDPRKDFRESMVEMIRAKGIRHARDLEDLLACYLSLNDAEHHDLIIEVFEQIWLSLAGVKP